MSLNVSFAMWRVEEASYCKKPRKGLRERQRVDAIVIAPDIEDPDLAEAQLHHITIRMKGSAQDLIWELSRLFPDKTATVQ